MSAALSTKHAVSVRPICRPPGSAIFLHTLAHKRYVLRKKNVFEYKMCFLIFYTTGVRNVSHSKNKWARYDQKCILVFNVNYPCFLSGFNKTWIVLVDFRKLLQCRISWKSVQFEPGCSMRTDRHMTKLMVAFRNFSNASEKKDVHFTAYFNTFLPESVYS